MSQGEEFSVSINQLLIRFLFWKCPSHIPLSTLAILLRVFVVFLSISRKITIETKTFPSETLSVISRAVNGSHVFWNNDWKTDHKKVCSEAKSKIASIQLTECRASSYFHKRLTDYRTQFLSNKQRNTLCYVELQNASTEVIHNFNIPKKQRQKYLVSFKGKVKGENNLDNVDVSLYTQSFCRRHFTN
jgi:hypothetical protein